MATDWVLPPEVLRWSPSRADGVSEEAERTLRRKTAIFIDTAGKCLKNLPRVGIATAQVYFQRFFALQSFKKFKRFDVAVTCLFLACKVEEYPRKLDYLICTCHQIWNRLREVKLKPDSPEYEQMRQSVLKCERVLLHTIAFDLCVRHPFDDMIDTVKRLHRSGLLQKEQQRPLAKQAVSFLNDSMRTNLCLQYDLRKVANVAIFLATNYLEFDLSSHGNKWLSQASITASELADISHQIMQTYEITLDDPKIKAMRGHLCLPPPATTRQNGSGSGGGGGGSGVVASRHLHHHHHQHHHNRPTGAPPSSAAASAPQPLPPPPPPSSSSGKRPGTGSTGPPDDPRTKRHRAD